MGGVRSSGWSILEIWCSILPVGAILLQSISKSHVSGSWHSSTFSNVSFQTLFTTQLRIILAPSSVAAQGAQRSLSTAANILLQQAPRRHKAQRSCSTAANIL